MPDLAVDLAALDSLIRNLEAIRGQLHDGRNALDAHRGQLGSGDLEHALDSFHGHWKDGRKQIDANATAVCKAGADIAANLRHVDGELARQLTSQMQGGPQVTSHDATVTVRAPR